MNSYPLDKPGWHAMNSHQRHLAIRGDIAIRYQPDIFWGAAIPEDNQAAFDDMRSIIALGESIGTYVKLLPDDLTGWKVIWRNPLTQMICKELKPTAKVEAIELTMDDVPDMLELVALTNPGPFESRTILMGSYIGVRQDGRLIAMAGERMHLEGYCEVSAVCTHPDYRGRGYGSALTTMIAGDIMARNEIPFLHLVPDNYAANRLYTSLGFVLREKVPFAVLKKIESETS